jgi:hypothetical protein
VSEPTREEKIRTIKAARQVMQNMLEQVAPDLREFIETQRELHAMAPAWARIKPKPAAVPQEDPEQAAMQALLAEVKNSKEKK